MDEEILCIACGKKVKARLTDGKEIYPHRADLYAIPFWKCDACENYVGCHHKSKQRTRPLGCIATPEILKARYEIHGVIDPLWRSKKIPRKKIYRKLSRVLGREYHTADLRSVAECDLVLNAAKALTH